MCRTVRQHSERLITEGFTIVRQLVPAAQLLVIDRSMRAHAERVMTALGSRSIGIGSRDGYIEIVQRSPGRFDVPIFDERFFDPIWGAEGSAAASVPWMNLVHESLGPEARPSFSGVVFSKPGSPAQQWHIDSPHESAEHRPAHAINVLLALADIAIEAGPTQVASRTHHLTNHLRRPGLFECDDLLYQTSREMTPDTLFELVRARDGAAPAAVETTSPEALQAGDCLVFDDRLLHRGLGNESTAERWVAYFSYMRPREGTIIETHFEATRSLFSVQG